MSERRGPVLAADGDDAYPQEAVALELIRDGAEG